MSTTQFAVASLRLPKDAPFLGVSSSTSLSRWGARGITFIRIPVAVGGILAVLSERRELAVLAFVAFAVIDVFDGMAARLAGCDTAARRIGDVILDRFAIHAAALTCCAVNRTGWPIWLVLLSRDVIQAGLSTRYVKRTRTVVIGAHWHMTYGLSMLAWGSAFILDGEPSMPLTLVTLAISVATFVDYARRCADLEGRLLLSTSKS